jgi:putative N6-adenine-specific DNA methylase
LIDTKKPEHFFIILPVGFETDLINEINYLRPWLLGSDLYPNTQAIEIILKTRGGVEIATSREVGFQLNHFLKTPVRLLWRWKSKKISHVSEFKSWIRSLKPQDFIDQPFGVSVSAKKSRLQNEKMLMRVLQEDWKNVDPTLEEALYLHVFDDQMTLSWDLSGEALYKRGWSNLKGQAPLRENIAHLLLSDLIQNLTGPELSESVLIDPMMGSGTFLSESLTWNQPVVARAFRYQMLKGQPGFLKIPWWKSLSLPQQPLFGFHCGFDKDDKMVQMAKQNLTLANLQDRIQLEKRDVFLDKNEVGFQGRRFLVCNPPYGERLKVDDLPKLLQASLKRYSPERALFVVPREVRLDFPGFLLKMSREFSNGGLEVKSLVFHRET